MPEDDAAAARRGGAAPLAEDLRHHLAGDGAARARGSARVGPAQLDRIDAEEQTQVVIADVLEVPAGAGVARDAGLPAGIVPGRERARRRSTRATPASSGTLANARHSEAKRTPRRARVGERAQVGADAEVVGDAAVGAERQCAAAGRGRHVGRVDAGGRDRRGQHLGEELAAPSLAVRGPSSPPAARPRCCRRARRGWDAGRGRRAPAPPPPRPSPGSRSSAIG